MYIIPTSNATKQALPKFTLISLKTWPMSLNTQVYGSSISIPKKTNKKNNKFDSSPRMDDNRLNSNPTDQIMKPNYNTINATLAKIDNQLFKRIEELAIKVVKANEGISGFCMAMGSASFSIDFIEVNEDGEDWRIHDDYDMDDGILNWQWKHEAAIKEIYYILDEYNWNFKLTGNPVRIEKVNGEITIAYNW